MSSDSDSDDEKYYEMKKKMVCHHAQKMSIICSGASNIVDEIRDRLATAIDLGW
jgi:hypothetical protein